MRTATVERITKETQIRGKLKIEGKGRYQISTGIRFFDHMLELFTKHGGFDLELTATGTQCAVTHHARGEPRASCPSLPATAAASYRNRGICGACPSSPSA